MKLELGTSHLVFEYTWQISKQTQTLSASRPGPAVILGGSLPPNFQEQAKEIFFFLASANLFYWSDQQSQEPPGYTAPWKLPS